MEFSNEFYRAIAKAPFIYFDILGIQDIIDYRWLLIKPKMIHWLLIPYLTY